MTEFPVLPGDADPAGKPDECFYCKQTMGEAHGPKCVLIVRLVYYVVHVDGDFIGLWSRDETAGWNMEECLAHKHGSTWCASNPAEGDGLWLYGKPAFKKFAEAIKPGCLCGLAKFTLVRAQSWVRYSGSDTPTRSESP